jgi:adenylate kinase family enzyme
VARVLVTGMYGTGKSTVLEELRRRGFHTVDTDYGDWEQAPGVWDASRMADGPFQARAVDQSRSRPDAAAAATTA